ncbi:hypothetical protein BLNAU_3019 [Blattamonas nauphoetae]|uniref:Uncharacterized protein n=1 Tax=Blattamonas nauphoetae TaxID=2049346 RepID=A0ABQ9YDX9_9EUKA|nr:hypothetical protein BLNAU_3019 [Blattamonas nauphoetae]
MTKFTLYTKYEFVKMILLQEIVVRYVWALCIIPLICFAGPHVCLLFQVPPLFFFTGIIRFLREPQPTPSPEDLYFVFFTGILRQIFTLVNIPCSLSDMHGLVVQIVDKYRPLTHSAFHTMMWDSASSTSTSFLVVHDVLQQHDKLRNLLPIDALFDHARLAFVEQGNVPKALDSENTVDFETRISPTEKRRKSCLRILTLIHEIRSRRTDTGETDWNQTPSFDSEEVNPTERVTRDHFDHTIFESDLLFFIV